jgi:hypothetical protein
MTAGGYLLQAFLKNTLFSKHTTCGEGSGVDLRPAAGPGQALGGGLGAVLAVDIFFY